MEITAEKKQNKTCFFFAFAAFISVWIVAIICGVKWETNDDLGIAYFISRTATGGTIFQHKLLIAILHCMYCILPKVNHWLICVLFSVSAGYAATVYSVARAHDTICSTLIAVILLVIIKTNVLDVLNFSKAAAIAMSGGMMLVLPARGERHSPTMKLRAALGLILMMLGASIRLGVAWAELAFVVTICVSEGIVEANWKRASLGLAVCFFMAAFVLGNNLLLSSAEKSFADYNRSRTIISDYTMELPGFSDEDAPYERLGLDENDYDLLTAWVTEDTEVFSPDVLKQIAQTKRVSYNLGLLAFKTKWAFLGSMQYREACYMTILSLLISVFSIAREKKRNWFPVICCLGCFCALYMYLVWSGRVADRVTFGLLWMLICSLLVFPTKEIDLTVGMLYHSAAILFAVSVIWAGGTLLSGDIESVPWRNDEKKLSLRTEVFDVISNDSEHIFIFPMTGIDSSMDVVDDWDGYPAGYCDNLFYLGGWDARSPYNIDRLTQFGISNPMRALFENDNVYSCRGLKTDDILQFLRTHYDECIRIETIGTIGKLEIIKFCR